MTNPVDPVESPDFRYLAETVDLECKLAMGRDGKGEVPQSLWETYSSMANTDGGLIFLGVRENPIGIFTPVGIPDTGKIIKSLWDTLNNPNKISRNLLTDSDIAVVPAEGTSIIRIRVPRAGRKERPVFTGQNPLTGTFVRRNESDQRADTDTIRSLFAESLDESRDDRILEHAKISDLDPGSIEAYKNMFSARTPRSPWLTLPVESFLEKIGACGVDEKTGKTGLRLAGLLMFGLYENIINELPNYFVDYQEHPEPESGIRWIDRIVPDSVWSGNLFDFFHKTYRKIGADIKVPFALRDGARIDETPVHEALREALTNTLIHADYTGRGSILVVKGPGMFSFRNPGLMRVPIRTAISGGTSDCRNKRLQNMFRYIGHGDDAGSGIPKVFDSWKKQHWQIPLLREDREFNRTCLELSMESLVPEESLRELQTMFGDRFTGLDETDRLILITAYVDGSIRHERIKEISPEHPKDISDRLARLVRSGMLDKTGSTRASRYSIADTEPEVEPSFLLKVPGSPDKDSSLLLSDSSSLLKDQNLLLKNQSSIHNDPSLPLNEADYLHNEQELDEIRLILSGILRDFGFDKPPRRCKPDVLRQIIIRLCVNNELSGRELSILLQRELTPLRVHYLIPMSREGLLVMKYPGNRTHPHQAYRSAE